MKANIVNVKEENDYLRGGILGFEGWEKTAEHKTDANKVRGSELEARRLRGLFIHQVKCESFLLSETAHAIHSHRSMNLPSSLKARVQGSSHA
ncbi:hypothetical protein EYF80_000368 [Liparis tanakae]|uniref:Uncharacterized protein n=1 Tax=Liparis tanakae TaxID=230148 RepID=A0A4Z2JFX9_9TELE|nr:hypothetical protein EYF80_000368 [Liparis tanakae]